MTGRTPATLEHRNASSAAARSSRVELALDRAQPDGRAPSPAATSASCPARIAQSSDGVASSIAPSAAAADEEQVGARRLGQVVVDGQEQGVVGAGPARLEPRVDVLRPGRRLERGERVLRVAPDPAAHEVQAVLEVPGRRPRSRPARPG